ncbi:MAG: acetyl-CoA carboxylase carboxyltransferase subunit alpha [Treponema sp.]|nr:acetyl-CoA carboxylase carboxyltransferase subunit alpha [Treponema sp.]
MPLNIKQRLDLLKGLERPTIRDYIPFLFRDFTELHGDRYFGDDPAVLGGVGYFEDTPITVIAHVRTRKIAELEKINFSMPHPEGYRKALRLAKQAEKFKRPVLCFIDTPGAYCGVGAEERGQGEAIARNLHEFMMLKIPLLSVILGEGGSGGALAMGVCDELAMLENALYSVISPKGFATILWKDASREREAAEFMKITSADIHNFGICDFIIAEPEGGAAKNIEETASNIGEWLRGALNRLMAEDYKDLPEKRYQKYRKMGAFLDNGV